MKHLLLLISPLIIFATEINFNKFFIQKVSNDKLQATVSIKITRNEESDIIPILNKYNNYLKENDRIKKHQGTFSITPKYQYKNGNSKIIAYNGNISYTISSKDFTLMNTFIKDLFELKDEINLSIVVSSLQWVISNKLKEETMNSLRLSSIKWANNYILELSETTNQVCTTKEININQKYNYSNQSRINTMTKSFASMDTNIPIPDVKNNNISLNVNYKMECK
jgi:hypothetical protein